MRRILSLLLAMVLCISLPMAAYAEAEGEVQDLEDKVDAIVENGSIAVETTEGTKEVIDLTISFEKVENTEGEGTEGEGTEGEITEGEGTEGEGTEGEGTEGEGTEGEGTEGTEGEGTEKYTAKGEDVETESGLIVNFEGSTELTTNSEGIVTGQAEATYTVEDPTNPDWHGEGSIEASQDYSAPNVTVDVPVVTDDPTTEENEGKVTVEGAEVGTKTETEIENGTKTETVVQQGSVTVETTDIVNELLPNSGDIKHDMDYVHSETVADNPDYNRYSVVFGENNSEEEKDDNHLYTVPTNQGGTPDKYMPGYTGNETVDASEFKSSDEYDYEFVGAGNYVYSWNNLRYEYPDGSVKYTTPTQFVMVDKETGEVVTTYCVDAGTPTQDSFGYNMVNLEDADYYDDESAAHIRTIAQNGYWGTTGTETVTVKNEDGTESTQEVPVEGSLEAMKQMLLESGKFSAEEVESMTDGMALVATQMALWSWSNKDSGVDFGYNMQGGKYKDENGNVIGYGGSVLNEDEVDMMFKVYEYLKGMDPTPAPAEEEKSTANTIITEENALKDMSITVLEKDEEHENNKDEKDNNDAYVTNVTFALVVTPSTENGDDMIVKVISITTDENGNTKQEVLDTARIAGKAEEGEKVLTADENGNYTFEGITLIEGNQEINISLEGVQNLDQGVYLFSSEIKNEDTKDELPSQTMVGMASGEHEVHVSVGYKFNLSVEDEVVYTEAITYEEWIEDPEEPTPNPEDPTPTPTPEIPEPTPTPDDPEPTPTPNDPTPTPDDPEPTPTPNTPEEDPEDPEDDPEDPVEDPEDPEEEPEPTTPVLTPGRNDNDVAPKRPEAVLMIMDEAVPQAAFVEIFDEEVPLGDAPETGDPSTLWALMSLASASGLFLVNRRRKV